jgi:hypothetical protein
VHIAPSLAVNIGLSSHVPVNGGLAKVYGGIAEIIPALQHLGAVRPVQPRQRRQTSAFNTLAKLLSETKA